MDLFGFFFSSGSTLGLTVPPQSLFFLVPEVCCDRTEREFCSLGKSTIVVFQKNYPLGDPQSCQYCFINMFVKHYTNGSVQAAAKLCPQSWGFLVIHGIYRYCSHL